MSKVIVKGRDVPVDLIKPSPYQPRLFFDLEDIRGSIMRDGILVTLAVRKKNGFYELVDGERRWRVAKELGYKTVPCDIIDIDDDTARRMVWKVNTLRKEYTTKEKAYHFKKLQEEYGMSLRGIARECDYSAPTVKDYLNVFMLPEFYQKMVWDGKIGIGHIHVLAELFNGGVRYLTRITEWLDQALEKRMPMDELAEAIHPELKELQKKRVEAAREAVPEIVPEVKVPESPEELDRAAMALRREARKRREEALTPEEKARIEAEKEGRKRRMEEARKRREEAERRKIEEEARKRARELAEAERRRIEEEARVKAKEELMKDPEFLRQVAETAPRMRLLEREIPAKMINEIDVGEVECPKCKAALRLIHCEPGRTHKVERKAS